MTRVTHLAEVLRRHVRHFEHALVFGGPVPMLRLEPVILGLVEAFFVSLKRQIVIVLPTVDSKVISLQADHILGPCCVGGFDG